MARLLKREQFYFCLWVSFCEDLLTGPTDSIFFIYLYFSEVQMLTKSRKQCWYFVRNQYWNYLWPWGSFCEDLLTGPTGSIFFSFLWFWFFLRCKGLQIVGKKCWYFVRNQYWNYAFVSCRSNWRSLEKATNLCEHMRWMMGMLSSCLFVVSWAFSRLSHFWICCGCSSASVSACVEGPSTGTCGGVMSCSRWTVMAGSTLSTMNSRLRPELVSTTTVNGTSVHDKPLALSLTLFFFFFFTEDGYNNLIFRAIQADGEDCFVVQICIFFIS